MLVEVDSQETYDTLSEMMDEAFQDKHYKYAFSDEYVPKKGLQEACRGLMFFSVDENQNIVGSITATHYLRTNKVSDFTMLNFLKKPSMTYAKDMYEFISTYIFEKLKVHKANWLTVIGSPYEKFSDKIAENLGGRVVGIYRDEMTNAAGELCDVKGYELLRADYLKKKYGNGED